jgi:hypothetical protein
MNHHTNAQSISEHYQRNDLAPKQRISLEELLIRPRSIFREALLA